MRCVIWSNWIFRRGSLRLLTKPLPDEPYDRKPPHNADSRATLGAGVHRIYLPAPLDAQARGEMQTRLSPGLQSDPVGALYGYAMEVPANPPGWRRDRHDPLHDDLHSWLRVSGTTERPEIDQCEGHQLHAVMPLLFEFKAQQNPLELIFPRKGALHA